MQAVSQADIFTHVYDPKSVSALLRSRTVKTTFIQRLPLATRLYKSYMPLMPIALEELDLSGYDLVISSEAGPAKGVIPRPDSTHVCYCHSPMRYIWDQYNIYKASAGPVTRAMMPYLSNRLRQWDMISSARVDAFAANSAFVSQRIEKYYRRDAQIVHPPVSVDLFQPSPERDDYFLWVGQLVPYKGCDIAIEAFNRLKLPLVIVGDGAGRKRLESKAGPTIKFVKSLPLKELARAYARAQALIFTAMEDFGIVPVEAQASGCPVIALGRGGALETVTEGDTGLFFGEQSAESLVQAVEKFLQIRHEFDPARAVASAQRFRPEQFDMRFAAFVNDAIADNAKRLDRRQTAGRANAVPEGSNRRPET